MGGIFISYRRDDTEGQAGRLYDDLVEQFGEGAVFMDVAGIEAGRDFRKAIDEHVSSCGVLLALIGTNWLSSSAPSGGRRLDERNDFVRLEIAAALKRDIPVVPVLVRGARMPRAEDLPDDCQDLSYRNGVELTHARWDSDLQLLVRSLQRILQPKQPEPAPPPVPTPPPAPSPPVTPTVRTGSPAVLASIAATAIAIGALAVYWANTSTVEQPETTSAASVQPSTPPAASSTSPPVTTPAPSETAVGTTAPAAPAEDQPGDLLDGRDAKPDAVYVCNLNPNGDNFLSLRVAPGPNNKELKQLGPNTVLQRLEGPRRVSWYRVRGDGFEGWVHGNWLCEGLP